MLLLLFKFPYKSVCSLFTLSMFVVLLLQNVTTVISTGNKGKGKMVTKEDNNVGGEEELREFVFRGSIEPKITDDEHMKELRQYQVLVYSQTVQMKEKNLWKAPVMASTDHQFSIRLRFHRNELLMNSRKESGWKKQMKEKAKKLFLLNKKGKSAKDTAVGVDEEGISRIRVEVKAEFHDRTEMTRTWIFTKPDFSLHYQLNVGVLQGENFWLRGKIAFPKTMKFVPDDVLMLTTTVDNPVFGRYTYAELANKDGQGGVSEAGKLSMDNENNIARIVLKLDAELVKKHMAVIREKPSILLLFKREERALADNEMRTTNEDKAESSGNTISAAAEQTTKEEAATDCSICLNEVHSQNWWHSRICKHQFHTICIEKWLEDHNECPICRGLINGVFEFLFEDPVFSNEHFSFEYKFVAPKQDQGPYQYLEGIDEIAAQHFWEDNDSNSANIHEQLAFMKAHYNRMFEQQQIGHFLFVHQFQVQHRRGEIGIFEMQYGFQLEISRLMAVKVSSLQQLNDENVQQHELKKVEDDTDGGEQMDKTSAAIAAAESSRKY